MRGVDRIARAAAVDESERRVVGLVALVFAAIEAGRGLGDVGVNTLVLSRLPADALPYLYIVLGLGSLVIAIGFGALLGRMRKARLFAGTLWGVAVALVVERLLISTGSAAVLPVLWLTVVGAGTIATTICWTVATSTFDARQAKRLFPLCTSAAIAGYFIGSLVAGPLAASVGTESLVIAQALLFLAAGGLIGQVAAASGGGGWAPSRGVRRPITADVRAGFDEVRASPLMRLVAVAYVLFSVLAFSVTFPFLLAARQEFPAEAELATALGTLAAAVTATSFVLSLLFANRIYARFGVVGAALVLPLAYLVGFPVWIVSFTFATAAAFAYVQQSIQRGLSNAAWSAMYNVVPARTRSQVLTFQDGVPGQVGVALSGVLLLTAARVLAPDQLFWIGLAAAAALTAVVALIRRHYTESLLTTLRSGAAEQLLEGGRGLDDFGQAAEVRALLVTGLASPDPMQRQMSATLLARSTAPEARPLLASALRDEDPGVRATAASALLAAAAADEQPQVAEAEASLDALLRGGAAERVAGAQAIRRLDRTLPADLVPIFATDPSEDVRSAAMSVLDEASDPRARAALVGGLSDRATVVRNAAADALAARPTLPEDVAGLLTAGTSDVQAAALRAMVGHRAEVGPTVLDWASARATRAVAFADAEHHLRDGLADGGVRDRTSLRPGDANGDGAAAGQTDRIDETEFLCDVLARRIDRNTDLVLGAIAVLEAPEARGVIRRSLHSNDPDVRAQAVEVLDTIGDRRLGHALSRLAEPGIGHDRETRDQVIARLSDDDDPWISGLARRVGREGDQVPDASPTLAHLETMLLLRRVPIFERLDPEDLARIAATAEERSFGPDERLMREGDPGDELYVLLEGRVHVTRHEAGGVERHVSHYGAGEHIGELAVLRDRPRAGTVVAGPQGVRALVIDGEGLKTILRERPDAAMAMLATLAERVTQ